MFPQTSIMCHNYYTSLNFMTKLVLFLYTKFKLNTNVLAREEKEKGESRGKERGKDDEEAAEEVVEAESRRRKGRDWKGRGKEKDQHLFNIILYTITVYLGMTKMDNWDD